MKRRHNGVPRIIGQVSVVGLGHITNTSSPSTNVWILRTEEFIYLFIFLFVSNLYIQHGAGTHDLKIESHRLFWRSQPGVPKGEVQRFSRDLDWVLGSRLPWCRRAKAETRVCVKTDCLWKWSQVTGVGHWEGWNSEGEKAKTKERSWLRP